MARRSGVSPAYRRAVARALAGLPPLPQPALRLQHVPPHLRDAWRLLGKKGYSAAERAAMLGLRQN